MPVSALSGPGPDRPTKLTPPEGPIRARTAASLDSASGAIISTVAVASPPPAIAARESDLALPILAGVIAGSLIARHAEPWVFKAVFVVVAGLNAFKLLFGKESWKIGDRLPGKVPMSIFGVIIGVLSALMGIGGGVLSNMIMTFYGTPIHRSVATSSGVGVLISIPATLGYVYAGWPKMDVLPPGSLGYISLIGFALLIPTTVLAAPWGVKIAHALERRKLEVAFGIFLLLVALRFFVSLVWA